MYKQHQVVLVATDKAENALIIQGLLEGLGKSGIKHEPSYLTQEYLKSNYSKSFHLYTLSEDEKENGFNIPKGSWFYDTRDKTISNSSLAVTHFSKKVIASTDKSLTIDIIPTGFKSGVGALSHKQTKPLPQIHQSFIEYFITEFNRGNIIDKVNVEYKCLMSAKAQMIDFGNNSVTDLTESECIQSELMIDKDNCINIKPIKESWSKQEVIRLILSFEEDLIEESDAFMTSFNSSNWLKENL